MLCVWLAEWLTKVRHDQAANSPFRFLPRYGGARRADVAETSLVEFGEATGAEVKAVKNHVRSLVRFPHRQRVRMKIVVTSLRAMPNLDVIDGGT